MTQRTTRRTFLRQVGYAGAVTPLVWPGLIRAASPNGKLRHAAMGAAGMSWSDMHSMSQHPKWELVAVADVDSRQFGQVDKRFPKAKKYADWRELLEKEDKNIDSVNVSTPDHMHAPIGVTAMNMGKHCYGQKPLGQNLWDTRALTLAARRNKVVTQMGIQIHSHVYYRMAVQIIQSGGIGKVREVHTFSNKKWGDTKPRPERSDPVPAELNWDLWIGVAQPVPYINNYYHPGNWRKRLAFGTGTFGDMGCHIYDPVFKALGVTAPTKVTSYGPGLPNEHNWGIDAHVAYEFPGSQFTTDPVKVTWYDGSARPPKEFADMVAVEYGKVLGRNEPVGLPGQGSVFIGENGMMILPHIARPYVMPLDLHASYKYPKVDGVNHWGSFIDACLGEGETSANFDYAGALTEAVLLGGVAMRYPKQELHWNAEQFKVTNLEEANAHLRREYRKGWEIKGISDTHV